MSDYKYCDRSEGGTDPQSRYGMVVMSSFGVEKY